MRRGKDFGQMLENMVMNGNEEEELKKARKKVRDMEESLKKKKSVPTKSLLNTSLEETLSQIETPQPILYQQDEPCTEFVTSPEFPDFNSPQPPPLTPINPKTELMTTTLPQYPMLDNNMYTQLAILQQQMQQIQQQQMAQAEGFKQHFSNEINILKRHMVDSSDEDEDLDNIDLDDIKTKENKVEQKSEITLTKRTTPNETIIVSQKKILLKHRRAVTVQNEKSFRQLITLARMKERMLKKKRKLTNYCNQLERTEAELIADIDRKNTNGKKRKTN